MTATISFPEPTCLLVSTKTRSSGILRGQTIGHALSMRATYALPVLPVTFSFHHTEFPPSTSATRALDTKPNHSASTNVLLPSFPAKVTGFFIRKSASREADNNNYSDKNASLYVSIRSIARARLKHAPSFDRCGALE